MTKNLTFSSLDPDKIVETIEILSKRIQERFAGSGLSNVCAQLLAIAKQAKRQSAAINRPIISLRIGTGLLIMIIGAGLFGTLISLQMPNSKVTFVDFIQVLEAGINDVVLIGLAIFFLVTLERRLKRNRALKAIHELRSIAHVIDMHQLTKDPGRLLVGITRTASSRQEKMTPFDMIRYLNYCSEMLSLTGKIAAVYVEKFNDTVVLASVNEVEMLTTGLSRKIWQKIMIARTFTE